MTNVERARQPIADARARGASDFCVCAGSRNAPLLAVLSVTPGIRLFSFVDERSAAFFALGRAKLTGKPSAVVTTSGTAVAELLPAVVEAFYSGTPLIVITADRPARYRGTGAPQCIEQEGIFGLYASASVTQVTVEFDERWIGADPSRGPSPSPGPNPPSEKAGLGLGRGLGRAKRSVVILGGIAPRDRQRAKNYALRLQA